MPALQPLLRAATTDCLSFEMRRTYLDESDTDARARYARIMKALRAFGFPLHGLVERDLETKGMGLQMTQFLRDFPLPPPPEAGDEDLRAYAALLRHRIDRPQPAVLACAS